LLGIPNQAGNDDCGLNCINLDRIALIWIEKFAKKKPLK
jgi:hypothetical protein